MAPAGPHKPGLQGSNPCSASNSRGTGYGRVVTGTPPKKPVLSRLWAMWTSGLCQQNVSLPAGFPGSRVRIPSCAPNSRRRLQNGAKSAPVDAQHASPLCALVAYCQLDRSQSTKQPRPAGAGDLFTRLSFSGRTARSERANRGSNPCGRTITSGALGRSPASKTSYAGFESSTGCQS